MTNVIIYQIKDGIIGTRREAWDSREAAMRYYGGDDYTTQRLWLQGWPNTSAQIVKGNDTNGVAIGDFTSTDVAEVDAVLGYAL